MRGWNFALILALVVCAGCPRNEPAIPIPEEDEGPASFLSTVNVADPRATDQLMSGFHALEQRSWRWTERKFSVMVQPPPPVPLHQPALDLKFTLPEAVTDKVGAVTLTARIGETVIGSEMYSEPANDILFTREVPDGVLGDEPVLVEFELDKAMPPTELDGRELALVAISIAIK
jgi:hypothetical protein